MHNLHLKRRMIVGEQEVFVVLCSISAAMSVCVWVYRDMFCCFGNETWASLSEIPVNRYGALVAWW